MAHITAEVQALLRLQGQQDRNKAALDAHRRDVQLAIGDEVLLDTEHTPLPSRSLLIPRWMGPFTVLAQTAPNTFLLDRDLPTTWRVVPEFNVERLRPYRRRPDHLGGDCGHPSPRPLASRARMAGLSTKWRSCSGSRCVTAGPTCWCDGRRAGRDASGDTCQWEPLDNLTTGNC
jgi:hypothetical protein